VCVADYPEDKIVSLRRAKNDRIAADRERLLQLAGLVKTPLPQRDKKSGMHRKMGNSLKPMSSHNESGRFKLLIPSASCRGQPRPFSAMATQAQTMNDTCSTAASAPKSNAMRSEQEQPESTDRFCIVGVQDGRPKSSSGDPLRVYISSNV
jgi:hypothetical protein